VKHTFTHFDLELKVMFSYISDVPETYISKTLNRSLITSTPTVMRKAILAAVNHEISNVVW